MATIATANTPLIEFKFMGITAVLIGSLRPEGDHMEPTIGQIWPR